MVEMKPLGHKNYGHIPHFPGSRMGPGDHKCSDGQLRIATEKPRDKHDLIIVQEKLDGSNVGVAKINGEIVSLTRAGYTAESSPFIQHHYFAKWVEKNKIRFDELLNDGERVCGEWLLMAHGTRYKLHHEPFVAFDIMVKQERLDFYHFDLRIQATDFIRPNTIWVGLPCSINEAMRRLIGDSRHGAIDEVEGAVWRVERNKLIDRKRGGERKMAVDYLAKYVRPDKKDGIYLDAVTGKEPIWNINPESIL